MYDICEGYDFGDLYGECYHGAMHAAFLWAVADAGEDVLGSVPVDGAFTGTRAEELRKASLEFEPMRRTYAQALYHDPGATLDDLREAVKTLEETERTARRLLGGTHPTTVGVEKTLQYARKVLLASEWCA